MSTQLPQETAPPYDIIPGTRDEQRVRARSILRAGGMPIRLRREVLSGGLEHLRAACGCNGAGGTHYVLSVLGVDITAHGDPMSALMMVVFSGAYLNVQHVPPQKYARGIGPAQTAAAALPKGAVDAYDGFGAVYLGQPPGPPALDDVERERLRAWAQANPDAFVAERAGGDEDVPTVMEGFIRLIDDGYGLCVWEAAQPVMTVTQRGRRARGERPLQAGSSS